MIGSSVLGLFGLGGGQTDQKMELLKNINNKIDNLSSLTNEVKGIVTRVEDSVKNLGETQLKIRSDITSVNNTVNKILDLLTKMNKNVEK